MKGLFDRRPVMGNKKKAGPDRRSRSQRLRSEISRRTGAPRRVLRPAGLFLSLGGDVLERAVHDAHGAGGRSLRNPNWARPKEDEDQSNKPEPAGGARAGGSFSWGELSTCSRILAVTVGF
jgi:hypothetical protein